MLVLKPIVAALFPSDERLMVNGFPLLMLLSTPVTLSRSNAVPATPFIFVTSNWKVLPPYHCIASTVKMPGLFPGEIVAPLVITTPLPPVKIVPLPLRVALLATTNWLFNNAVPLTSCNSAVLTPLPTTKLPTLLYTMLLRLNVPPLKTTRLLLPVAVSELTLERTPPLIVSKLFAAF